MSSKIYWGKTAHARTQPVKHVFSYPLFSFAFELGELPKLKFGPFFGYNRRAVLSIWDKDYLHLGSQSICTKLVDFLKSRNVQINPANVSNKIFLVTTPKLFGYVFNPVSFYLLEHSPGILSHVIAEVANTFGEKHLYLMDNPTLSPLPVKFNFDKAFFVSPFFDISGQYQFVVKEYEDNLNIMVSLEHSCRPSFWADITGKSRPITYKNILLTLLCYPLSILLTMPRINYQALKLYFVRGLTPKLPKLAQAPDTIRSYQTPRHKIRLAVVDLMRKWRGAHGQSTTSFDNSTLKDS